MWSERLLNLIFPSLCPFCGRVTDCDICAACESVLPRAAPVLREGALFGRCVTPLRYEGVVRESLLRFKFHGMRSAAQGYAPLLARCVEQEYRGAFSVVSWAPISRRRLKKRGYDQAFLVADAVTRLWGTKPERLLDKSRDIPPQSSLDMAARLNNVKGAYRAVNRERIEGARVLLIDDILTTGSTLGECAHVLYAAGAADVMCACIAAAATEKHSDSLE